MIMDIPSIKNKDIEESMKIVHTYLQNLKQELEYNFMNVDSNNVILPIDLNSLFGDDNSLEKRSEYWNRIKAITDDLGRVITEKLQGSIRTSTNKIINFNSTVEYDDLGIILHNEPTEDESTWAMRLGAGGFAISSTKDVNNAWVWSTFGTGEGFTADMITTGKLYAITVEACTLVATNITSGTINGVTITGSEIYIGDVAAGNYIEISPNNPIKVWRNKKVVSSLGYSNIGGGNLTLNDVGGNLAFKIEQLSDGRLQIFCNSGSGVIPDPNNPGFVIPNPNPRVVYFDASRVAFQQNAAGIFGSSEGYFWPFLDEPSADYRYVKSFNYSNDWSNHIMFYHNTISDKRLKENIEYVNETDMLEFAKTVNLAKYNVIGNDRTVIGVIAQDIVEHPIGRYFVRDIPNRDDGMMMVDYELLATSALGAVRSLAERLETLEEKVNLLAKGE